MMSRNLFQSHRKRKRVRSLTWAITSILIFVAVRINDTYGLNNTFTDSGEPGATTLSESGVKNESLAGGIHNTAMSFDGDDFDFKKENYTDVFDTNATSATVRTDSASQGEREDGEINPTTISPSHLLRFIRNRIDANDNASQSVGQHQSTSSKDEADNTSASPLLTTVNSSFGADLGVTYTTESPEASLSTPTAGKAVKDIWYICHGILGTVVEVVGVVGNIVSIAVLVHPDMRSSTGIMLTSLAVYDMIVLMSYLFLLSMDQIFQHTHIYANFLSHLHRPSYPVWYGMSSVAFMGSSYTTVAISIERLIVVTVPLKASAWCTESRAKVAVILIFIFCALYNIPRYMVFSIESTSDETTRKHQITLERTWFSKTYFFKTVYSVTMNIIMKVFLPLIVLSVCSCLMVRAVRRNGRARRTLQVEASSSNHTKFSAMVVAVMVFSLLSLLTGSAEVILLRINDRQFQNADDCEIVCAAVSAVSELMAILNSGVNFLLFCVFGTKFREVFRRRFCKRWGFIPRNSSSQTFSLS